MRRSVLVYAIVIALSIAAIAGLLRLGETWFTPVDVQPGIADALGAHPAGPEAAHGLRRPLALLIVQLLVIVLAAQVFGFVASLVRQPAVIGEIAAGVLLGPSLLGYVWPDAYGFLFPPESLGVLRLMSQIGVILFMFTVGLDLDPAHLRQRAPTAIAVSHFSIVIPFVLGVAMALWLFPSYAPPGVRFHAFGLFMGIALSITAFPVLARVIEERRLTKTPLGSTAIACAAVDDVTAWSLLAMVVTLVTAGGVGSALLVMVSALAVFFILMTRMVKPVLARVFQHTPADAPMTRGRLALVLAILLASALTTEVIGIHALFGAFLAGVVIPASPGVRQQLRDRIESLSSAFLLPIFFAFTGLRTEIGLLNDAASWAVCAAIIAVAIAGKLVGSMLASRWTGSSWHDAFAIGALMNTRGLMELVALNVGYDLGILSPSMFTMLVVMALVTTAMTGPLLDLAARFSVSPGPVPDTVSSVGRLRP
jgi:Kef-type K+ transport system membrane component KefB